MAALGLDAPRVAQGLDALFDTFDPDGSGSIDYNELHKVLDPNPHPHPHPDPHPHPGPGPGPSASPSPNPNQALKRREALDPSLRPGSMGCIELKVRTEQVV